MLPALIPYERFLQLKVRSDTLMLVPLWNVQDHVGLSRLDEVVLVGGIARRRPLRARPAPLCARRCPRSCSLYFAIAVQPIQAGPHGMEQAAAGALFEGIRRADRDWIDRAVPRTRRSPCVWTGKTHRFTVNMNEFFNRSVGPVYTLGGPMPGGLPETAVGVDPEDRRAPTQPTASAVEADYVLTDGTVALDGDAGRRATRARGHRCTRSSGPLVSTTTR